MEVVRIPRGPDLRVVLERGVPMLGADRPRRLDASLLRRAAVPWYRSAVKARTIRIEDGLAEWIRQKAFDRRWSEQKLINHALERYRCQVEGAPATETTDVGAR